MVEFATANQLVVTAAIGDKSGLVTLTAMFAERQTVELVCCPHVDLIYIIS